MSGIKILNLPEAEVPLSGSEVVPIVQGGETRQVPASSLGGGLKMAVGFVDFDGTLRGGSVGIESAEEIETGVYGVTFEEGYFSFIPAIFIMAMPGEAGLDIGGTAVAGNLTQARIDLFVEGNPVTIGFQVLAVETLLEA